MAEASLNDSEDELFSSRTPSTEMQTIRAPPKSSRESHVVFVETSSVDAKGSSLPEKKRGSTGEVPPTESTPLVRVESERGERSMVKTGKRKRLQDVKAYVLCALAVASAFAFAFSPERETPPNFLIVSRDSPAYLDYDEQQPRAYVTAKFEGLFTTSGSSNHSLSVKLVLFNETDNSTIDSEGKNEKTLYLQWSDRNESYLGESIRSGEPEIIEEHFSVHSEHLYDDDVRLRFVVESTEDDRLAFALRYQGSPAAAEYEVLYAGLILVFVYVLIVFELVHRTTAAFLGSLVALATLALLNKRPTLEEVMEWIDYETVCLLFGMMTIVAIFSSTGFFDWAALRAYKLARGKVWPLVTILCLFSGVISAFLDNVTTILLMTPVSIRLCQVLNLDPTNILIAEVLFSNIGGTATAVGDPPNVIIVSNKQISQEGITFATFTAHLCIGIVFCMATGYGMLRLMYRNLKLENTDPPEVAEMKREVEIWRRTAERVPTVSAEQKVVRAMLMQKCLAVETAIRNKQYKKSSSNAWRKNLPELEKKYRITDKPLLIKSSIVLVAVVVLFFSYSFVNDLHVELGWIAILGAVWLIVLADIHAIEFLLEKIEWATLLFFAGLFILMEALEEMGLIDFIGEHTADLVRKVDRDHQLLVAIVLVVWVSAIASSFIDNIPFTTAMIPIIIGLGRDPSLNLPLPPLVWSLAMGACLGGNGTLIGASANVVCAGLAEQHGYPISFNYFFKYGFPMMLVTVLTATAYLLVCHVAIGWNSS